MIAALFLTLALHAGPTHTPSPLTAFSLGPLVAPRTSPEPPPLVLGNPGVHLIAAGAHPSESRLRFRARRTLDRAR